MISIINNRPNNTYYFVCFFETIFKDFYLWYTDFNNGKTIC